jgi:hypothetical protein
VSPGSAAPPPRRTGLNLEQATELRHVGDTLYIGFNEDLRRVSFPKLETVGGALIIEANPALEEIHLPALVRVQKYIHLHDLATLRTLDLQLLQEAGGELSLVDCPALFQVRVGRAAQPARVARLEVKGCGAPMLPGLHARS